MSVWKLVAWKMTWRRDWVFIKQGFLVLKVSLLGLYVKRYFMASQKHFKHLFRFVRESKAKVIKKQDRMSAGLKGLQSSVVIEARCRKSVDENDGGLVIWKENRHLTQFLRRGLMRPNCSCDFYYIFAVQVIFKEDIWITESLIAADFTFIDLSFIHSWLKWSVTQT